MSDEEKVKKGKDSIFMVCLVVFLLAVSAVTIAHVDRHYIAKDQTPANTGNTVEVDYVGTFYGYYGSDGAAIFDTTYKSIGESTDVKDTKSNDYTKGSFSKLSMKLGSDNYLKDFQNAVLGHKAGDTVYVKIGAADAYWVGGAVKEVSCSADQSLPLSEKMPADKFESFYKFKVTGVSSVFKSAYGWDAVASFNSADNTVNITYIPEVGKTYTPETKFGTVNFKVSSVTADKILVKYEVKNYKTVGEAKDGFKPIQMIKLDMGMTVMYITSVGDESGGSAGKFCCKNVEEKNDIDLYFKITVSKVTVSGS